MGCRAGGAWWAGVLLMVIARRRAVAKGDPRDRILTGFHAFYCFPLRIGVISMGVLALHRDQPGPLSSVELSAALLCADIGRRSTGLPAW
jgi:hypothetical protein